MATLRTYGATVDQLEPVAHWGFHGTKTDAWAAERIAGLGGAFQGKPASVAGTIGDGAVRFNGAGTYLEVASAGAVRLAFLGDSLVAGFGLAPSDAFPGDLVTALEGQGLDVEPIINGQSGRETGQALGEVAGLLAQDPDVVVLVLGTNDSLRSIAPATTEANLRTMVEEFQGAGVDVLLTGTFGLWPNEIFDEPGYDSTDPANALALAEQHEAIYPKLAAEFGVELFAPFHGGERIGDQFAGGVLGDPALNQGDGVHPNAAGVDQIVARILPQASTLVMEAGDPLRLADGSIEMWFTADQLAADQGLLSKDAAGFGDGGHLSAVLRADGAVQVDLASATKAFTVASAPGAVEAAQATQLVFTFGATGMQLYLNGELVAQGGYKGGLEANLEPLVIGATQAGGVGEFLNGVVDEVTVYDRPLAATEVTALFEAGERGDKLVGTAAADVLIGSPANDVLRGLAGGDLLDGRGGKDLLVGGPGADRFHLTVAGGGVAQVKGFESGPGGDVLDLSDLLDDAVAAGADAASLVQARTTGGGKDTLIDVATDDAGTDFVPVARLFGVGDVSLEQLLAGGNIELPQVTT